MSKCLTPRRKIGPYSRAAQVARDEYEDAQRAFAGRSAQARDEYDSWARSFAAPGYAHSERIVSDSIVSDFYRLL